MVQDDSDSEDEVNLPANAAGAAGKSGCSATAPNLTKVLAKEEKLSTKVEPDLLQAAKAASTTKSHSTSTPAFPFQNLLTSQQVAVAPAGHPHLKDAPKASSSNALRPAARHSVTTSSAAILSMAVGSDISVLAGMGGSSSSSLLPGGGAAAAGPESRLASLMSSKNAMMLSAASSSSFSSTSLVNPLNNRDSDGEPVYKKPRKHESFKVNPSSSNTGSSQQPAFSTFSKMNSSAVDGNNSGFPHHPSMAVGGTAQRLLSGTSGSHSSSGGGGTKDTSSRLPAAADAVSASSVRLAGLPGVSLTAVVNMPRQQQQSGRLMPPPATASSSVTLSPVPRTLVNSDSVKVVGPNKALESMSSSHPPSLMLQPPETSDRKLFPVQNSSSNTGNSSSSSIEISPYKLPPATSSAPSVTKKSTMLINPVTGQFEVGPSGGDSSSEGEGDLQGISGKMISSSSSSSSPDSDPDRDFGLSALDYPGSTKGRSAILAAAVSVAVGSSGPAGGSGGEPSLKL